MFLYVRSGIEPTPCVLGGGSNQLSYKAKTHSFFFLLFLKGFISLFIFREREREGEREEEKHQCVVTSRLPPAGNLACNPGMFPDWESNWHSFQFMGQHSIHWATPARVHPFFLIESGCKANWFDHTTRTMFSSDFFLAHCPHCRSQLPRCPAIVLTSWHSLPGVAHLWNNHEGQEDMLLSLARLGSPAHSWSQQDGYQPLLKDKMKVREGVI